MLKLLSVVLGTLATCGGFILQPGTTSLPTRHAVGSISVSNGGDWGGWGTPQYCPLGSFAAGFDIMFEAYVEGNDNTALNGIKLYCVTDDDAYYHVKDVTSYSGAWGVWLNATMCPSTGSSGAHGHRQFLTSFDLMVQPQQGGGDDTAANFIKFGCRTLNGDINSEKPLIMNPPPPLVEGSWSNATNINHCPQDSAICGIKTKVEPSQFSGDDTALNDVIFYCCDV